MTSTSAPSRRTYNAVKVATYSTEKIERNYAEALAAVKADEGKRYRGYRWEAQMQRTRALQMWAQIRRDRAAGLV